MWFRQFLWAIAPIPFWAAPFWRQSWPRRIFRGLLVFAFYCYVGVIGVLIYLENRLLYQAVLAKDCWFTPPYGLPVADAEFTTADGAAIYGWWSAPANWQPGDGALLYLHGNGANLSCRGGFFAAMCRKLNTAALLVDYPGYGRSGGVPSERACYQTADAAFNWLTVTRGIPADRVILYGGSLGGGVATDLAVRRPHRALVLVSTFTSFPEEAQSVLPWTPARWVVRNRYDNLSKIPSVHGPVFVSHGTADWLIPFSMSERLYAAVTGPKRFYAMKDWGHEDILTPDALAALSEFLDEHRPAPSP